ncbi:MAG TPA: hypothetical protein PK629_11495 [Oscillospiraceae bacterium]|nr:hypothetical protein [Oscillospiraceae bacterium]HPK35942.1 hypothetical protein [Oscillospiraceae bacterium]HPR75635.1 hypothetical protein [Oscillospiraceae bacterium]
MEIMIAIIGSGALSALISGIFVIVRDRKAKKDGIRAGVRQLLYDKIKGLGKRYITENEITAEDLEDLMDMHKIYHDELSGNGYIDHIMEEVKKLKITNS